MPRSTRIGPYDLARFLEARASARPSSVVYSYREQLNTRLVTAEGLLLAARRAAGGLLRVHGRAGRVAICLPHGPDFASVFWGCVLSGAIPIPLPAISHVGSERFSDRLTAVLRDAEPTAIVCAQVDMPAVDEIVASVRASRTMVVHPASLDAPFKDRWRPSVAYLQYTSGSTSRPRGVRVSQRNIVENCRIIARLNLLNARSILVNWVPTYHDQGLVYGIIGPVVLGYRSALLDPRRFVESPADWLRAISAEGATHSGGPTAGYSLCLREPAPEETRQLSLSSWRVAYCAGERVVPTVLRAFVDRYSRFGFRPTAVQACYGLAEATLRVAAAPARRGLRSFAFDRAALNRGLAKRAFNDDEVQLASHGPTQGSGRHIAIVDPARSTYCADGTVGEIWVSGPHVAAGYWRRRGTTKTFGQRIAGRKTRYLRTGDLGFRFSGSLFIVGRLKDTLIVRGVNHYPEDVELAIQNHVAGVRAGRIAAFASGSERGDDVVVAAELSGRPFDSLPTEARIRRVVAQHCGLEVSAVWLCPKGTLPITTSGKLSRHACRQLYWARSASGSEIVRPSAAPIDAPHLRILEVISTVTGRLVTPATRVSELGIDSLMALELCSAAAESGLGLTVEQLYRAETVLDIRATSVGGTQRSPRRSPAPPLLPMQRFELRSRQTRGRAMRPRCYFLRDGRNAEELLDRVALVQMRNEALRSRFKYTGGAWHARYLPTQSATRVLRWFDLSFIPPTRHQDAISEIAADLRADVSLTNGPQWSVAFVERGLRLPAALVVVLSHLVADRVSAREVSRQLLTTHPPLQSHATSVSHWASTLAEFGARGTFSQEADRWVAVAEAGTSFSSRLGGDASGSLVSHAVVSRERLTALLDFAGARGASLEEAAAAVMALALARWLDSSSQFFQWFSSGRDHASLGVRLASTIGCLYYYWPHSLELRADDTLDVAMRSLIDFRSTFSHGGLGYNVLAYYAGDPALVRMLDPASLDSVCVNFLGHRRTDSSEAWLPTTGISRGKPEPQSPARPRIYIELEIVDGELHISAASVGIGGGRTERLLRYVADGFTVA